MYKIQLQLQMDNTNTVIVESVHVDDWFVDPNTGICWYRVHLKLSKCNTRILCRRYSQFRDLNNHAKRLLKDLSSNGDCRLSFPSRPLLGVLNYDQNDNDKRCRELDYYLQQLLSCFGSRFESFWNAKPVVDFFSDNPEEQVKLVGHFDSVAMTDACVDWGEWETKLRQAEEIKMIFSRRNTDSNNQNITNHYQKMFDEFKSSVEGLHEILQQHPNHPDTMSRWARLEPLVDYIDAGLDGDVEVPNTSTDDVVIKNYVHQTSDRLLVQEKQLELIAESIQRLKSMGKEMGKEVEEQNELAVELTTLVSNEHARTDSAVKRANRL